MPRSSHPPWFDLPYNICWRVRITGERNTCARKQTPRREANETPGSTRAIILAAGGCGAPSPRPRASLPLANQDRSLLCSCRINRRSSTVTLPSRASVHVGPTPCVTQCTQLGYKLSLRPWNILADGILLRHATSRARPMRIGVSVSIGLDDYCK
jgi:hypothetical protein